MVMNNNRYGEALGHSDEYHDAMAALQRCDVVRTSAEDLHTFRAGPYRGA